MIRVLSLSIFLGALGCYTHPPNDARTAVEMEAAAEKHQARAALVRRNVEQQETMLQPPSFPEDLLGPADDPTLTSQQIDGEGRQVVANERTARDLQVARRLRETAAVACERLPPDARLSCPMGGPGARIEDIPGGVRIRVPPAEAEQLAPQLDCAIASAHVATPPDADRCPLYVPGASSRVVRDADGTSLEIVGDDAVHRDEIRRRARAAH
jgi:hypothetical protein